MKRTALASAPRRLSPLEQAAHDEVHARAAGIHLDDLTEDTIAVDEILGRGQGVEFSHRVRAGQGGAYRPANGIWVSRAVHEWLDDNRTLANLGGWQLLAHEVPQDVPVWLARPWPGWWLIDDLVVPHLLVWADEQPPRPRLPFESAEAYRTASLLAI